MHDVSSVLQTTCLDPVFVTPVQNILSVGMFQDEAFATARHDFIHLGPDVFRSLPFELFDKLNAPGNLLEAGPEVAFPELRRLVEQRHAVEIYQVKHLNYSRSSVDSDARKGSTHSTDADSIPSSTYLSNIYLGT